MLNQQLRERADINKQDPFFDGIPTRTGKTDRKKRMKLKGAHSRYLSKNATAAMGDSGIKHQQQSSQKNVNFANLIESVNSVQQFRDSNNNSE